MRELEARTKGIDDTLEINSMRIRVLDEFTAINERIIQAQEAKQEKLKIESKKIDEAIIAANNRALANLRRTAAFSTYIFQAMGVGIGQSLTLLAETVSLTVETARLIQQTSLFEAGISAALGNPATFVFLAGLAVRAALIASLIFLNVQIVTKKNKFNAEFQNIVGAMRILTI